MARLSHVRASDYVGDLKYVDKSVVKVGLTFRGVAAAFESRGARSLA
jgi:hypothetical protein